MRSRKIPSRFPNLALFGALAPLSLVVTLGYSARAATIQTGQSTLAILTDKEGLAARLAHRHIIVASKWGGELLLSKDGKLHTGLLPSATSGQATISIQVKDLLVDSPEAALGIIGVLEASKRWDVKTDKLEPGNAVEVRQNMLDASQLNADKFPSIDGIGKFSNCEKVSELSLKCSLHLTLKIRGLQVVKEVPIELKREGANIVAEFSIPYRFKEFGIKPYSAMFGAIAVKDEFFFAARIVATEP